MPTSDPIRVLYVIDSLAPGGAETSLAVLAPALRTAGVDLIVAPLLDRIGVQDQLVRSGATVLHPPDESSRREAVVHVRKLIRATRPHVVHTTLFEADIAGRLAAKSLSTPVTTSLVSASYGPAHRRAPGHSLLRLLMAQATDAATCRVVTRFHAVSHDVAEKMGRRLAIPKERIVTIPRARDPSVLGERNRERRLDARKSLGLDSERVLLAVARGEYPKGLDVLLRALAHVPPRPKLVVLCAGREGADSHGLRELAAATAHDVRFLGHRNDVPELLCAADTLVAPSRWEGMPGAVIEAMALGLPIIASDIPPMREVLGDERSAIFVPVEDEWELAQAISTWDPAAAKQRAAGAKARFLRLFTPEPVATSMYEFFKDAIC